MWIPWEIADRRWILLVRWNGDMTLPESWMKKLPVRIPPRTSCERCVTNIWYFDTFMKQFSPKLARAWVLFALVSGSIYGRQTAHLSDDQTCFLLAWLCSDHVSLWMFNIQHWFNIVCLVWSCVYWLLTHSISFIFDYFLWIPLFVSDLVESVT